jgi:ORF6N domain-containing protein
MEPTRPSQPALPSAERLEGTIVVIRGRRVLLDADLATLYGVSTRALIQAIKRNRERFPSDFMFRLSRAETANLRSQSVISSSWGGRRHQIHAFTEQGVAMISGVLRTGRAVRVNIEIMRAFVRLRRFLVSQEELARKVETLEKRHDDQFKVVFDALRSLMAPPVPPRRRIGFSPE